MTDSPSPTDVRARLPSLPVAKYYAYTVTTYASFSTAIWILFVRSQGLSFAQVGVLNSVWWAGLVLAEVPTGYVGDRIGRRNSMVLGSAVVTAMTVGMGLSSSFPQFALVYAGWAVGYTFRSGSDDAWLYDLLAETGRTGAFARVRGRATGLGLAVGAITAPLGGALADVNLRYPFFATAAVTALAIPVLLTVPESGDGGGEALSLGSALAVVRGRLARPPLRSFVLYFALLFGVLQMTYIFDQPVTQAAAVTVGVPESTSRTAVGVVYGGFTLVAAAVSYNVDRIRDAVGTDGWFRLAPALVGALFAALWVVPALTEAAFDALGVGGRVPAVLLAVPVFFVARAVNTASLTLGNQYVNDRVESFGRATTLSAASMLYSLAVIPFEVVGGYVADLLSPTGALAVFGVVLLAGAALLWTWEAPVERDVGAEAAD